ncbi:hypothetical protein PYCC9005_006031 [Savitreella phatthalungensis]
MPRKRAVPDSDDEYAQQELCGPGADSASKHEICSFSHNSDEYDIESAPIAQSRRRLFQSMDSFQPLDTGINPSETGLTVNCGASGSSDGQEPETAADSAIDPANSAELPFGSRFPIDRISPGLQSSAGVPTSSVKKAAARKGVALQEKSTSKSVATNSSAAQKQVKDEVDFLTKSCSARQCSPISSECKEHENKSQSALSVAANPICSSEGRDLRSERQKKSAVASMQQDPRLSVSAPDPATYGRSSMSSSMDVGTAQICVTRSVAAASCPSTHEPVTAFDALPHSHASGETRNFATSASPIILPNVTSLGRQSRHSAGLSKRQRVPGLLTIIKRPGTPT